MNGGFALKLACAREDVVTALLAAARDEVIAVEELARAADGEDDPRILLGLRTRDRETIVVTSNPADSDVVLEAIGEALAARLSHPTSLVVDSDEGNGHTRSWHGGNELSPEVGFDRWDDGKHLCFALTPPAAAPLAEREGQILCTLLDEALPSSIRALDGRFVEVARRVGAGPIVKVLPSWQLTLAIPDAPPLVVSVVAKSKAALATQATSAIARKLDKIAAVAARRVPASPAFASALAGAFPGIELVSVERSGFYGVTFHVRARIDQVEAELTFDMFEPPELPDATVVKNLRAAIEDVRDGWAGDREDALEGVMQAQLANGELDAAAATYRTMHAEHFAAVSEARAIELSLAKVQELARLYKQR